VEVKVEDHRVPYIKVRESKRRASENSKRLFHKQKLKEMTVDDILLQTFSSYYNEKERVKTTDNPKSFRHPSRYILNANVLGT
jgi:hypothetical protein